MSGYVLLLRGINVGGRSKLAMADLRTLLTGLGFSDVRTHLGSGNAVFTTKRTAPDTLARRIEQTMAAELGRSVPCLIRTAAELARVIAENPLRDVATNGSRMMVHFLFDRIDPAVLAGVDSTRLADAYIAIGELAIYQWCPDGLMNAPSISDVTEKRLAAVTTTSRNWNTVTKLDTFLNG